MKKLKSILFIMMVCLLSIVCSNNVYAASSDISVKSSSKTAVVGNTIKVTITVSSSKALGSWEFDVKYDSSKLTLVSSTLEGSTTSVGYVSNSNTKSKTYTMTFKAKKSGSAKIYIDNSLVFGYDENKLSSSEGSVTVNVITQAELEASYSSDNYLKSLTVSGYDLTPKFDKGTLTYSLELENDVREIKVSAKANDSKADVDGTGKHSLSEGENKITIRVTAENGNVRNYVINALVKELNPINVTVDGKDYTVLRKAEGLEIPSTFTSTTTTIEGEEVPAFESSITGYLLVALKDENGDISFFIYDDETYTLYEERIFTGITLYIVEPDQTNIPDGYQLTDMSISGVPTKAYKSEDSTYPLLYGINVQTGKANWYTYDENEMTLQRFVSLNVKEVEVDNTKYLMAIGVLGGTSILLLIFLIFLNIKTRKYTSKKIV